MEVARQNIMIFQHNIQMTSETFEPWLKSYQIVNVLNEELLS